jgi:RecA-family ATPase
VGINEGAGSWEEWKAWADAYLDGDPLIEDTNTYTETPLLGLELIDGLIRQPHVAVLSGKRAIGKSMFLMDMAVSVSAGVPFLGTTTEQANVLFVNVEQDTSSILNRFLEVKKHKELEGKEVQFDFLHLLGSEKPVLEFFDFLVKRIEAVRKWEQKRYSMVVIDGLSRIPGWNRVDSSKDGKLFSVASGLDRLILRTRVAVVLSLTDEETAMLPFNPDLNLNMFSEGEDFKEVRLQAQGRHIADEKNWTLKKDWPIFVKD